MSPASSPLGYVLSIIVSVATTAGVLFCFDTSVEKPVAKSKVHASDVEASTIQDSVKEIATVEESGVEPIADLQDSTTAQIVSKLETAEDNDAKLAAILELSKRPEDELTVPALVKSTLSSDELVRLSARSRLAELNERVVPYLKSFFESKDIQDYYAGCEALRSIGPAGKEYLVGIAPKLDSPSTKSRMAALFALSKMGPHAIPFLQKIIEQLDHKDMNVRLWACRVLISMEKDAAPAAPKLIELLENGVRSDKGFATLALGAIGPSDDYDVVAIISQQLDAFTQPEKERALIALAGLGELAKPSIERVKQLMRNSKFSCIIPAAIAHWKITGESEESVQAIIEVLKDISYRQNAAEALGQFGAEAAPAVAAMIANLSTDDEVFRESLVISLGEIGAPAKPALVQLRKIKSRDPDRLIRFEADKAIKKITDAGE